MTTMRKLPSSSSGFTIIELMVGMLVGLLATVVMFQVFAVSEGQKRTTTGAGDAQQNGVGSVFVVERDARMAGFGMNFLQMVGCPVSGWNSGDTLSFYMAPYVIKDGAAGAPDTLTIAYGDTRSFASPQKVSLDMTSATGTVRAYNRFGFANGDLFILASTTNTPCTLYQVQDLSGTDGIEHKSGGFTDPAGVSRVTTYNNPTGNTVVLPGASAAVAYPKWDIAKRRGTRIINLGQSPTVVTYSLVGNQLIATDVLNPKDPQVVVSDGIVQFQVQYAFDFNGDGIVNSDAPMVATLTGTADQWADALPANPTPAMWAGIIGVRFAIVSRSATPEKADAVSGLCPTTAAPKWLATGRSLDVSADANWKCYRYRVFEVTVPARNLAWMPDEGV